MRLVRAWKLGGADRLSPRERDVARLLAEGHSHKAIARILGVAPTTIRTQTYRMYRKLGVRNRAQMVGTWLATGIGPQGDRAPLTPTPTRPRP
ncbi:MAG: response regulator transcription factor [Burkholderiales bacterium]|nr:helix-turn-helix transcriptional regulator [Burkholderiales bacterium]MCZ8106007.1 helix-turn-helix transcriptional regulator [Burkholderiales bacterium]